MTRPRTHRQTPPLTPLRRAWLIFALTGLGCCVGVLTLLYGAAAYIKLPGLALFRSYFHHPALLGLNLLPPVLLIWLFYFLTRRGWGRAFAAASCAAVCAVSCASLFTNSDLYQSTDNSEYINPWSDVEVFVSKGCLYPFLYSMRDMFPAPPPGYDGAQAQALLEAFSDADIPADKQVSVMGIMLEAFCDLTDFDFMAGHPDAARVYDPWHALTEQGVSGRLLTNIFAGGTVDSEWGFLSGYSQHDDFRRDTDSYVWYLRDQGYQTFFSHPGYGWFYNRQNVNDYLGWFTENHYGALVDPTSAIYHSDDILVRELLAQLTQRTAEGPCFSFSVSYQNHGPYESAYSVGVEYFTPANSGMAAESCHIWNNYLRGVDSTIQAMVQLTQGLEELDRPVVLVLFGDHKLGGQRKLRLCRYGAHLRPWYPSGVLRLLRHALSHLGQLRRQGGAGQRLHWGRRGLLPLLPHAQGL